MRRIIGESGRKIIRIHQKLLEIPVARILANFRQADISFFYTFRHTPYGGGNQFLKALWENFEKQGLKLENNVISRTTRACLINSHHIETYRLRSLRRPECRIIHRVDGPIGVYRNYDDGTDKKIWKINQEFADTTIFQSHYSLEKHIELGMEFNAPTVIPNAADPDIFHPNGRIKFSTDRKIRLVSSSWSDNPNKGAPIYHWLEGVLDWERFEYTFIGNSPIKFKRIKMLPPQPSHKLAGVLRQHDIYITASRHDPCSNSLIEALSCGLPALFLNSGGHPEIVGIGGIGFDHQEEIPAYLDQLVTAYPTYQSQISLPTIEQVAKQYLKIMGIKT